MAFLLLVEAKDGFKMSLSPRADSSFWCGDSKFEKPRTGIMDIACGVPMLLAPLLVPF